VAGSLVSTHLQAALGIRAASATKKEKKGLFRRRGEAVMNAHPPCPARLCFISALSTVHSAMAPSRPEEGRKKKDVEGRRKRKRDSFNSPVRTMFCKGA